VAVQVALATEVLRNEGRLAVEVVLGDILAARRETDLGAAAEAAEKVPAEPAHLAKEGAVKAGVRDDDGLATGRQDVAQRS